MASEYSWSIADDLYDQIVAYLGEPPLLKNERQVIFRRLYTRICCDLQPQDFFSHLQVYHFVHATWSARRYERYAAALLEKLEHEKRVAAATKRKECAEFHLVYDTVNPDYMGRSEEDLRQMEAAIEPDFLAEINAVPDDIDFAVFCGESKAVDRLHRMINAEHKKRDDALRQLAWHNAELAKRLRRIPQDLLDGKVEMIDSKLEVTGGIVPAEQHSAA